MLETVHQRISHAAVSLSQDSYQAVDLPGLSDRRTNNITSVKLFIKVNKERVGTQTAVLLMLWYTATPTTELTHSLSLFLH